MLAVVAAGLIGYALGGWVGVAVGACSATAVSVLLDPLTPPGDRLTAHERRMRKNRRYRTRYEALEEHWRKPYRTTQRTNWAAVDRRVAQGMKIAPPPIEIVPLPADVEPEAPAPAQVEAPAPATAQLPDVASTPVRKPRAKRTTGAAAARAPRGETARRKREAKTPR